MKTIIFYARSLQCKFYGLIGLRLQNKYNILYLVQKDNEEKTIKELGCRGQVYNIQTFFEKNWNNNSKLQSIDLENFEELYKIPSLWGIFYTDRFLNKFKLADSKKLIKLHIALFDEIFSKNKINMLVNEEIAIFSSYILYFFCKKNKTKYLGLSNPRQIGDRKTAFVNSDKNNFYRLDKIYNENNFDEKDLKLAKNFINEFREKELIPPYMTTGFFSKKLPTLKDSIISFLKFLFYSFNRGKKSNYMDFNQYLIHINNSLHFFRYQLQRFYYNEPMYKEKYYFFPLHYQPEASTLVSAANYEKQLFAIDLLAKKIPVGSILYVKEHYSILGHREMNFYRSLKDYPNIKFISPWISSHKLIKNSEGVIVLTGTVGWEAILYSKPVFVLGKVFYNSFKYANVIENIDDLSHVLKNFKSKKISKDKYDKELIKFVSSYLKSSVDGVSYLNSKILHNTSNIKNISDAIIKEIESL